MEKKNSDEELKTGNIEVVLENAENLSKYPENIKPILDISSNSSDNKKEHNNSENSLIRIIRKTERNSQTNYNYLFKIALIGDSGSGKSSILIRFTDNDFREDTSSTIGVDFKIVSVSLSDNTFAKMQIWDTCGSERFKSLTSSFIKSCPAFLLIFDITKYKSFANLENWINIIKENTNPKLLCLIGNKSDLESHRQVSIEEALKFAEKHSLKYIETSARTNERIEEVFVYVSQSLHDEVGKVKKGESNTTGSFEIGGYKNLNQNLGELGANKNNFGDVNKNEKKFGCC
jgi:small GTP-binding protein